MTQGGSARIGVVAPGRPLTREVGERLRALAPGIRIHPQCFLSWGHFAGPDEQRAAAFIEIANDPALDVLWFGRGGYGSVRIVEAVLAGLGPAARGKTYVGYSDAGSLLGALHHAGIGRVVHGPMPADLARAGGEAAVRRVLGFLEDGSGVEPAAAARPSVAFNLTILAHLVGTPWLPDLTGRVLMIEEVSEPLYRIDRALAQVTSAPALRGVAGIMLGRCSDIPPNDPDFGQDEEAICRHWCARSGIPYLGRADIGHDVDNKLVPFAHAAEPTARA